MRHTKWTLKLLKLEVFVSEALVEARQEGGIEAGLQDSQNRAPAAVK